MRKLLANSALALAALLSGGTPMIEGPGSRPRKRGKGKGRIERIMGLHRSIYRRMPEDSRNWHNPKDPVQAERIAAAQVKRDRKGEKLHRDMKCSMRWNGAHQTGVVEKLGNVISDVPARLNPLYVNREVV